MPLEKETETAPRAQGGAPESDPRIDVDHRRASRIGWMIAAIGVGGFALWAGLAPLDEGVPTPGQVVVTGNRKLVQNLNAGVVEAILVKDGDTVRSGDILVRLDATPARSQLETARSQWLSAKAAEARLLADSQGSREIRFPAELTKDGSDPRVANAMAVHTQLLRARRAALEADVGALKSGIAGLEASVAGLEAARRSKEEQLKFLREELRGLRDLAGDGYLPRNRLSEQERLLAQLQGAVAEDEAGIARAKQGIAEQRMRIVAREQDYRRESESSLSDAQKEASSLDSRIRGLEFDVANTLVKAPSDGIVVNLSVHTVGGVVPAGHPLMEVVPGNEALKIDAQIPSNLIDKVRAGQTVYILFPALNQRTTPQIPGVLTLVAADATVDPQGRVAPFYKAQAAVTPEGMKLLGTHEIRAGMPAEIFIKSGERTLMNYLVKPIRDRLRSALAEP